MPRGDGTGPRGMGAMSGRTTGYCAGYGMPGYANPVPGRGWGAGFGGGRGWRGRAFGGRRFGSPWFAAGMPGRRAGDWPENAMMGVDEGQEKRILKNQLESLDIEVSALRKRLSEIEKAEAPEPRASQ